MAEVYRNLVIVFNKCNLSKPLFLDGITIRLIIMIDLIIKKRRAFFWVILGFLAFQALIFLGASLSNAANQRNLIGLKTEPPKVAENNENQKNEVTQHLKVHQGPVKIRYVQEKIIVKPDLMQRSLGTGLSSLEVPLKNGELEKVLSASESGRLNIDFRPYNASAGLLDYLLSRTRLSYYVYVNGYPLPRSVTEVAFSRMGDCNAFALRMLLLAELFGIKARAFTILEEEIPGHVFVELWHPNEKWSAIVDPVESFVAVRPNSDSPLLLDILDGMDVSLNLYAVKLPPLKTIILPKALGAQSRQGEVLFTNLTSSYGLKEFGQVIRNRFQKSVEVWQRNKYQGPYTLKTYSLTDANVLNVNHALPNENLRPYIHPLK